MSTVYLAIIVWRPTATDLSSESTLRSVADTLGIIRMKVRNMLQGIIEVTGGQWKLSWHRINRKGRKMLR